MRTLKYSIVCEDVAHLAFITNLLALHFNSAELVFEFDKVFHKRFSPSTKNEVEETYKPLVEVESKLNPWNLDLLIIGMDYDNDPREEYIQSLEELYKRIDERESNRFCIFYPVKSIEHWLMILRKKIENPALTKNITDEIENTPNNEMKKVLYNEKEVSKTVIISSIMAKADLEWLSERSLSFRLFYHKLKTLC